MAADRDRWNARYAAQPTGDPPGPRPWLVAHQALLPPGGVALDAAMGLGGSAGWLAERGWRVLGADLSEVGVRRARARWPALLAVVADLERAPLPVAQQPAAPNLPFDLILDFYYLDRGLWPQFRRILRPGGLLIMETFVRSPTGDPHRNPAYRLEPGELRAAFADWEVLDYQEGEQAAAIVCRK